MKTITRLYVDAPLRDGALIALNDNQSRYVAATLRAKAGQCVAVFNGRDGQWNASITDIAKKQVMLAVTTQTRQQQSSPDIWLCFAPVKNEKIDFIAKRACELGVSRIWPVLTEYTQVSRVNTDRLKANVIEAAEQCERLDAPDIMEPVKLLNLLGDWDNTRQMIHPDESGSGAPIHTALVDLPTGQPYAALIGPEGGFSPHERQLLTELAYVTPVSLGPRILRAETAVLATLAHMQALLGDWDQRPSFKINSQ